MLGPSPAKTVKVSDPAPALLESDTVTVRKSQSVTGLTGAALHCSMIGLKFGVSPVQDTVTTAPSVRPEFGLADAEPAAPPTWTKKMLDTNIAAPMAHTTAARRLQRRRAATERRARRVARLVAGCMIRGLTRFGLPATL